jgi:hypothetical protein
MAVEAWAPCGYYISNNNNKVILIKIITDENLKDAGAFSSEKGKGEGAYSEIFFS